jgi:hypothetical protein
MITDLWPMYLGLVSPELEIEMLGAIRHHGLFK